MFEFPGRARRCAACPDPAAEDRAVGTIRLPRSRPSALALSLALLLTALFVYVAAMPALQAMKNDAASAQHPMATQLRMEGMERWYICDARNVDSLQARILAASCVEKGGAGMLLPDGKGWAVVREAISQPTEGALGRSAPGLSLALEGSAAELAAVADALRFLYAQATETGALAAALENGSTDAASLGSLLQVYLTQGQRIREALEPLPEGVVTAGISGCVAETLARLEAAIGQTEPAGLRLLHAGACEGWIRLLEELAAGAGTP